MINCLQRPLRNPILLGSSYSSLFHISNTRLCRETRQFKGVERSRLGKKRARGAVCGFLLPVDPWAPNIDSQSIASQLFAFSLFPYIGFLYYITKSRSTPKLALFGFYFLLAFVGATNGIHLARNCSTASKVDRAFRVPKVFSSTMSRGNLQIRPLMKLIQLNIQIACVLESIAEHLPYKIAQDVLSTIAQVFNSTDLFLVDLTGLSLPVPAGIYAKVHYGTSLSNVDWLHGGAESLLTLSNLFVVLGLRQALRNEDNAKERKSKFSSETEKEKSSI